MRLGRGNVFHVLPPVVVDQNAKTAAPCRFWGIATALRFFLIGGSLLAAGDQLGHTGEFLFADHTLIPEIPVEVVQPQILGHTPLLLPVGHIFPHAVTPFCIYCPLMTGGLFLGLKNHPRL